MGLTRQPPQIAINKKGRLNKSAPSAKATARLASLAPQIKTRMLARAPTAFLQIGNFGFGAGENAIAGVYALAINQKS
jgi:hypothetical protein